MSEHTPLPRNSKGEIILNDVFDAKVWAQEFMRIKQENDFVIDESLMLAWFANAIMAGYDHANAKLISQNKRLREAVKEWIQWFDYCHAYQQENLGKGLEQAEENWGNMFTPDPSPSIDKLRQALNESE